MKKNECRLKIRELWREQNPPGKRKYTDARNFYLSTLQKRHPELLSFRVKGGYDKWQIVKGFISDLIER